MRPSYGPCSVDRLESKVLTNTAISGIIKNGGPLYMALKETKFGLKPNRTAYGTERATPDPESDPEYPSFKVRKQTQQSWKDGFTNVKVPKHKAAVAGSEGNRASGKKAWIVGGGKGRPHFKGAGRVDIKKNQLHKG